MAPKTEPENALAISGSTGVLVAPHGRYASLRNGVRISITGPSRAPPRRTLGPPGTPPTQDGEPKRAGTTRGSPPPRRRVPAPSRDARLPRLRPPSPCGGERKSLPAEHAVADHPALSLEPRFQLVKPVHDDGDFGEGTRLRRPDQGEPSTARFPIQVRRAPGGDERSR